MNKNKVAFLLVIVLGLITVSLFLKNGNSTLKSEESNFAVADTHLVNQIVLSNSRGNAITLERDAYTGSWLINHKHPARKEAVERLLYIIKSVHVTIPVSKELRTEVIKKLTSNSVKVEVFQHDELTKAYYIGNVAENTEGAYMLLYNIKEKEYSTMPFVTNVPGFNGDLSAFFTTTEQEWRSRTLFHYTSDNLAAIAVTYTHDPTNSFELNVLDNNTFELKNAAGNTLPYDTSKVKQYLSYYFNVSYERIENLAAKKREKIIAAGKVHHIKITDKKGAISTLATYRKYSDDKTAQDSLNSSQNEDSDRMYAVVNDNKNELAVIPYYAFGKLFVPISYFYSRNRANPGAVKK